MWFMIATAWAGSSPNEGSLTEVFAVPHGAARVPADSFGTWLRSRHVEPASVPVRTYAGAVVHHSARVISLPMVKGDLQQCADSAMRLRAEFLHEHQQPVTFHATSGDPMPWSRWQAGERPYEQGGRLKWKHSTEGGWDAYLSRVFMWAGTRSLYSYDTKPADGPPAPGDVLVAPGSPGHAVILLDVASRGSQYFVLVGEGFMPAQNFHVELGPAGGWWPWDGGVRLDHWDLHGDGVHRRFRSQI